MMNGKSGRARTGFVMGCCLMSAVAFADSRTDYREGVKASMRGDWVEVEQRMSLAIAEESQHSPQVINVYSTYFETYVPHLFRGIAYGRAGNCETALSDFDTYERFGVGPIDGRLVARMLDLRTRCGGDTRPLPTRKNEVRLGNDVLFADSSAAIQPDARIMLGDMVALFARYPKARVHVVGHSDATGSAEYNQILSERRARSVTNFLVTAGIDPAQIESSGVGSSQPRTMENTPEGWQVNRRVEVWIVVKQ